MDAKNREDRVTFELMDRIVLEEKSGDISVIRNVQVTPEIEMVAEYSSYRIRGALVFTGEYEARKQAEGAYPLLLDRTANYNKRVVRQIYHRIPVDISVPADRVDDDGIVMEIVSLDYDLTDPNLLVVTTELELQGVYKEEVVKNAYWDQTPNYEYVTRAFENEAGLDSNEEAIPLQEQEEEEQGQQQYYVEAQTIQGQQDSAQVDEAFAQDKDYEAERVNDFTIEAEVGEKQLDENREENIEIEVESSRIEQESETELFSEPKDEEPSRIEANEQEIPIEQEPLLNSSSEVREPDVKVTISKKERDVQTKAPSAVDSTADKTTASVDRTNTDRETTASLLSMFLKNREETMTQIKMCLVQPGETLADIARRYNTNEDDILAINDLSVTSAVGGKVLKIPVRKAR